MKRSALVLFLALAGPSLAPAQTPPPAAAPSGVSQPGGARDIKFTNRSSFQADGGSGRNPFLPIGYARAAPVVAKPVELNVTAEMFLLKGTMNPDAIINGKIYSINGRIPLNANGSEFVTVRRIEDGSVILDYRGRLITIGMGSKKK